jgi:hypothetical protein
MGQLARIRKQNGGYVGIPAEWTADPYWSSCVLALRCDGTNGGTTFTDLSLSARGNATVNGNAQVSTAQSKFYGSSLALDGTGDWLEFADSDDWLMSRDFTWRVWLYTTSAGTNQFVMGQRTDNNNAFFLRILNGYLRFYGTQAIAGDYIQLLGPEIVSNQWYFVEVARNGNVYEMRTNGLVRSQLASSVIPSNLSTPFVIGRQVYDSTQDFVGYMNDIQVFKGVYIPPAEPLRPFVNRQYPSGVFAL